MALNSDYSLVRIISNDQHEVTLKELLQELKFQDSWHLLQDALKRMVLMSLFDEYKIEIDEDDVIEYIDRFREDRGLFSEAEISAWLDEKQLSDDEFYDLCSYDVKLAVLKNKMFSADKIAEIFAGKKLEIDAVELYHLVTPTQDLTEEILALVKEGADFYAMAKKFSTEEATRKACGYMGRVRRSDLRAEIEAAVFGAKEGEIVGPFKGTRGYHLYLVDEILPAQLDEDTRAEILDELFASFLQDKLRKSQTQYLVLES